MMNKFNIKNFVIITLVTSIWIHISEILRALFVAFPRMNDFFADKIPIGPMAPSNMIIWGVWDLLLTAVLVFVFWLCANAFGNNIKTIIISACVVCTATIGVFWIATVNTGLGEWSTALVIFPFALGEFLIGSYIASKLYRLPRFK